MLKKRKPRSRLFSCAERQPDNTPGPIKCEPQRGAHEHAAYKKIRCDLSHRITRACQFFGRVLASSPCRRGTRRLIGRSRLTSATAKRFSVDQHLTLRSLRSVKYDRSSRRTATTGWKPVKRKALPAARKTGSPTSRGVATNRARRALRSDQRTGHFSCQKISRDHQLLQPTHTLPQPTRTISRQPERSMRCDDRA